MNIHVTCPVCQQELEVEAKVIEDSDGDATIPYGLRHFLTLDEYTIDWQFHEECERDVEYNDNLLKAKGMGDRSILDRLEDDISDRAIEAYKTDGGPEPDYEENYIRRMEGLNG